MRFGHSQTKTTKTKSGKSDKAIVSEIQTETDLILAAGRSSSLSGTIIAPGDKSISHRALIFGALAAGETQIEGLLEGEDVLATAKAMGQLGAQVSRDGAGAWRLTGVAEQGFRSPENPIDFGNSGTAARLVMGAISTFPIQARLLGDRSLSRRPMGRVITPLSQMGVTFQSEDRDDQLPLTLKGAENDGAKPIEYRVPVPSAQVKSAILLAGLNVKGRTTVLEAEATRDHTERMLELFGVTVSRTVDPDGTHRIAIDGPAQLKAQHVTVPGDPSSAAFATVSALITPDSDITIKNVLLNPHRIGLYTTLREMGGHIEYENPRHEAGEDVADLRVRSSKLHGIDVPPQRAPSMIDEYPILSIAAARAQGTTTMAGLAELRVKESDRLSATAQGLTQCGLEVEEGDDWLRVTGRDDIPGGALIATHHDHRIAMSFLTLGLSTEQTVRVDGGQMIATSYPGYQAHMQTLGANISGTAS